MKKIANKWMRLFVAVAMVAGIIFGFANFSVANASSREYCVYSLPSIFFDERSVCVPVFISLKYPATTKWECTVNVFGDNYSRTKTFDVFYSGQKSIVFSNDEMITIKTNASEFKKPVEPLIAGKRYNVMCSWRRKGQVEYEYVESIPKSFTMPFPKLEINNAKVKKNEDGSLCLRADIANIMRRGRVDYWFEVICDYDSCHGQNIGMGSNVGMESNNLVTIETNYNIPEEYADKQYRFRIVGWDYARNEKYIGDWCLFKK